LLTLTKENKLEVENDDISSIRIKITQVSGGETWVEGGFSDVPHTWYNCIMDQYKRFYS